MITHTFPAYNVVELKAEPGRDWVAQVTANSNVRIRFGEFRDGSPRFDAVTFGSIVSYAIKNDEDPVGAVDRCRENMKESPYAGHAMHWVNKNVAVLSDTPSTKKVYIGLNFGDVVRFEGLRFRIERAPNDNVTLVRV